MASENTIDRALKGLGSTMISAGQLVRKATVDFGHAHEARSKLLIALPATLVCCLLLVPLLIGGDDAPIEHVELPLQSARVRLLEDNSRRDPDILLINIDDAALAHGDLAAFGGDEERKNRFAWPWPRSVYNKIIRYCRAGGARVIVFDFLFSESGPNTNQFRRSARSAGRTVSVLTLDQAGDDLFVLEATARDDVVLAAQLNAEGRPRDLRDELLPRYGAPVKAEEYEGQLRERFARLKTATLPIAGMLDGMPEAASEHRGDTPEEKRAQIQKFKEMINLDPLFGAALRNMSLLPLTPAEEVRGVAGVGFVNVIPDADGSIRRVDFYQPAGDRLYESLALAAYRQLVLSYAREAQADNTKRAAFAERFPGLTVDDKGVRWNGKTHTLENRLTDVAPVIENGVLEYLGARVPLDAKGTGHLRYRNFIDYRELPAFKANPEGYTKLAGYETPFAVYPNVSARDVLQDWDFICQNERIDKAEAEIARLQAELDKAAPEKKADAEKALAAAKAARGLLAPRKLKPAYGDPASLVKDKVVFIAGAAPGLYDQHETPLSAATPGTWILATQFDNVRNSDFMAPQPRWQVWLWSMLVCVLALNATFFAKSTRRALAGLAVGAVVIGGAGWLAFEMQNWFHLTGPMTALFVGFTGGALVKALTEGRQKAQREAFARQYMGTELVDYVISRPQALKLGGENRQMTIYFSDVAGFTTVTETLGPEHPDRLVELLNIYLERMTDIMLDSGGVIDKYIGDAIMCFWGAPKSMEDHAVRACKGALACKAEMARMQPLFADAVRATAPQLIKPDGTVLAARAGINTGIVTVGNMGSSKRFAYTVMGDAVNLASRLEGQNKEYGSWIMLGENTEKLVRGEFTTRRLDLLVVKGKTKPTEVFELLGPKEAPQFILDLVRDFERGIECFRNREFDHALEWFKTALQNEPDREIDNPSALYIERCETFLQTPPAADWNGVFVKKTK